ncbi:rhodanese-like domain-containing protein [Corticibacter populi]|uniref:Rhodanese-like domain-containing protein n=1 Tax=Corticibacter populi TaxID=1550736 RepID=A0A3M6QUI7_9BURK|nr:rhodanese-like domain-containing protein [Corticibacter populi]RMX06688.1 rhodanese-like domain-containing protein [Corticibacter populi]RZS31733.1 rhodanese-related sulfurtransferase [Corticibacter populi]
MNFFLDNWYLFLIAIGSGAMLFVPALNKGGFAGVTPAQAVQKINRDKAVVVDVRGTDEFAAGHIKGAKSVPVDQVEQQLPSAVKNKATALLLVCASGTRAKRAVAVAKKLGYENAQTVVGGMKAWKEAGLPVVAGKGAA